MDVNPWSSTIIMDACRVCSKQFCCRKHRATHEMEEHKRVASSVQTLPEICQKCSTFVSNINDLNSECAQLTNKRYNVLSEHSPNIIVDRPRKRTYSMMNIVKDPMLNSEQDCLRKRPKTQAKKRIGSNRKIFEKTELEIVKKDSQETSPKFEEIKSSSTPIKRDQQDLRVKLLKSKLEPPKVRTSTTNADFKLLSPLSQKGNFSYKKTGTQFETSCDRILEDEIEKSIYGTPGSENVTPFIKGKKCNVHWRKGDSTNVSIYVTPESSLISVDTSTVSKSWTDDQEFNISNSKPNRQIFTESEREKLKNVSKLLSDETESSEKNRNKEAEKISISLLELDNKLLGAPSSTLSFHSKMTETNESDINIEATNGKLHISNKDSEENLCIKKDVQILSGPQVNNYEEEIVDQEATAFFKPSTKMEIANYQSYHQRRIKDFAHTVPLNIPNPEENFTGYLEKTQDLNSSVTEIPLRQELPPDFQQRCGGDDKQVLSEESTPDSITEEIVRSQFLNNNSFYFEPIPFSKEENKDKLRKIEKQVDPSSLSSTEELNLSCSHKLIPAATSCENTTEFDSVALELPPESNMRVEMKKQLKQFELPDKSIPAVIKYLQEDQNKSPQENQNITIYNTVYHLDDEFYTPFKESPDFRSCAPQSFIYSNAQQNVYNSSSYASIDDWKSFNVADKGSQEPLIQNSNNSDNQGGLINIENISNTPKQSCAAVYREKNNILHGRDPDIFKASLSEDVSKFPTSINTKVEKSGHNCHSFEGNTTSPGDVSSKHSVSNVIASTKEKYSLHLVSDHPSGVSLLENGNCCMKNQSLEKNNVSGHCSRSSDTSSYDLNREVITTEATCSQSFPLTEAQKQNLNTYEEGRFSSFEDSLFNIVASTPMVRPRELTSASLDEDSINTAKNSSLDLTSKNGLFKLAKNRVKSYFPYFFKSKTRKSKSTEDLHSSSFQAESLQSPNITLQISQVQSIDKTSEGENLETISQRSLKRRPIWSWPKRRRPIHENRARVTEDTFSDAERIP